MNWYEILLPDQRRAASHTGSHSRLLAGPGTGKTLVLTRRILYLIQEASIPPDEIMGLTFTRAAAQELRRRVNESLPAESPQPRIHTLHSFALRQLLLNSDKLDHLPTPLRIADDWEERYIIQEDLKTILDLVRIKQVEDLFHELSSDWQSLSAELGDFTPDARFIGAWQEHRSLFGYTLRSELIFQLKRALEQVPDFELETPIRHLLVDEYQDLNRCDLSIIQALVNLGPELFIAGDDDQSIYGFRKAHPEGIRSFHREYPGSEDLTLNICMRCDSDILALSEFVADLDTNRIPKNTRSEDGRQSGEVSLLGYPDQFGEARGIASICNYLISVDGYSPSDILILTRVNTNNAISRVLEESFDELLIPFSADVSSYSPFDEPTGRIILSALRLLRDQSDHLSWRTILRLCQNNIGDGIIGMILSQSRIQGISFSEILIQIENEPAIIETYGTRISNETQRIRTFLRRLIEDFDFDELNVESFGRLIREVINWSSDDSGEGDMIYDYIASRVADSELGQLNDLLSLLETDSADIEQEIDPNSVNMLTMHKAKGLTSEVVIILGAEDEFIPGRQESEPELGDERRLLFVSLSRAKHKLFVTFCATRTGQQSWLGRPTGSSHHTLSRFLRYAPIHPVPGIDYILSRWGSN